MLFGSVWLLHFVAYLGFINFGLIVSLQTLAHCHMVLYHALEFVQLFGVCKPD